MTELSEEREDPVTYGECLLALLWGEALALDQGGGGGEERKRHSFPPAKHRRASVERSVINLSV